MLQSFTKNVDQSTYPATVNISNAVLAPTPIVPDKDIEFYTAATTTFKLRKDIKSILQQYGPDKAFAVTVGNQPVYYGKIHPAYLSSLTFGLPTIDPLSFSNNELQINYVNVAGASSLQQLDKRNDSRILAALSASGRLR